MPATSIRNAVVEDDPDWLAVFPDGRVFREAHVSVSEEEYRRMYQGYMCANCFEPLDPPFPDVCTLQGCGFHMKTEQRKLLDTHFGGTNWLGPSQATLNRLDNEIDKGMSKPTTGIWIPERSSNGNGSQ